MPRHCKSIPHEQVQFRAILVATNPTRYHHSSRKVAKSCDMSRLQYKKKSHRCCNCWNSIAVMFELHCSEFELDCSESAGQPTGSGRSLSRMSLASCTNRLSRSSASFLFASRARFLKALAFLCTSANGFVYS